MKKKICILFVLISIIVIRYIYKEYTVFSKYNKENIFGEHEVYVIQKTKEEEYISYLVENFKNEKFILNIFKDKENKIPREYLDFKYGDVLKVKGNINKIDVLGNPHEFNYLKYLHSKNICTTITSYTVNKIGRINGKFIFKISYSIKDFLNNKIEKSMSPVEGNLLKSMLYGDTIYLDEKIETYFSNIGITHILAVSGSNVASVVAITYIVLKNIGISRSSINIYCIYLVIIFTIISSLELSIVRASIMVIILILSEVLGKKYYIWSSIYTSFYLIILYNPHSIYNIGMQLSFMATIGIVMFYSRINNWMLRLTKGKLQTIISMLAVTLSAQIMIMPMQINYFNSFNIIMFVSNIIAVYIADIICNIGFTFLFISWIPYLSTIVLNMSYVFLKLLIYISKILSIFSFLEFKPKSLNIIVIFLYYLIIIFIYIKLDKKKILVTLFCLFMYVSFDYMFDKYLKSYVVFFNVGQGDMSFIKSKNKTILIDSGSTKNNLASNILLNYLKKEGIKYIDYLIISHAHEDHINGINQIMENIDVLNLVYATDDVIESLEKEKKININKMKKISGEYIKVSESLGIKILSPGKEKILDNDYKNANSLVCLINIKSFKILYTGDATITSEKNFLSSNIGNVDILKIGHHGSKTSTSDYLLMQTNPKLIIISSRKKDFGHPHEEVVEKIRKYGFRYHITELNKSYKKYI